MPSAAFYMNPPPLGAPYAALSSSWAHRPNATDTPPMVSQQHRPAHKAPRLGLGESWPFGSIFFELATTVEPAVWMHPKAETMSNDINNK